MPSSRSSYLCHGRLRVVAQFPSLDVTDAQPLQAFAPDPDGLFPTFTHHRSGVDSTTDRHRQKDLSPNSSLWCEKMFLPYSTGDYGQYLWVKHGRREFEKKNVYIYTCILLHTCIYSLYIYTHILSHTYMYSLYIYTHFYIIHTFIIHIHSFTCIHYIYTILLHTYIYSFIYTFFYIHTLYIHYFTYIHNR